ncbi:MAG: hypothetical protein JST86_09450 [Bacteroidetes bacterium]|nr:hypothetical protein [Bacteroidota bacterium]
MILKSLSRKTNNTGQLVKYICRYVLKEQEHQHASKHQGQEQKEKPFLIRHNLRSRTSLEGFIREFQENEKYRLVKRKSSVRLYHTIISLSNLDKEQVTDAMLKDIGKEFIRLRGKDSLYLGTRHEENVDHLHLHFIISGTRTNGRSSRISKQKFASIKRQLQQYQQEKYPELTHSLPEHGKKKRLAKEQLIEQVKKSRQTNKESLLTQLEAIYMQSPSKEAFLQQVQQAGYEVYQRSGRVQGVLADNKKFRFSRLGFDDNRLQQLGEKRQEHEAPLAMLQQIREQKVRPKRRAIEQDKPDQQPNLLTEIERIKLTELEAVRSKQDRSLEMEHEEQERTIGTASQQEGIAATETDHEEAETAGIPTLFKPILKPTLFDTQ